MICVDAEGRATRGNPAAQRMFGREGVSGAAWIGLVHPDDRASARVAHVAMIEQGRAAVEARVTTLEGRVIDAEITLIRAPGEGLSGHLVVVRDARDRRAHAQRLQALEATLEARDRAFDELLSAAAHELSEPVRKVSAFTDLIRDRSRDRLDDDTLDYLDRVRRAASRMDRLLRDVSAFCRVSTATLPFSPVDLGESARAAVAATSDGSLRAEVAELPTIEADAFQMQQLFGCLLANAIRFRRPGEPAIVRIDATESAHEGLARITVADEGVGFEQANAARIFRPFERLHGRRNDEGSGLGLAVCKRIVERHGGAIDVQSTPGNGATFIMTIPIRQRAAADGSHRS